ncbi:MAG TPA: alpha/beta hydrolase [Gaiellaceae bacterium]|nr:alpha/beta hydrolase [Gaiellaceae bacterium]
MERAVVDGIALAYEDAGDGEPVVCIHGAFVADAFRPLLAERSLADRYRLISYHRRGYVGSSPAAGTVRLADQAADCGRVLTHLGVRRAHVVGHSFGGTVALRLALDAPEAVGTLSLLEAGLVVGDSAHLYREALERAVARYREAGAHVAVDEFLRLRWPAYREHLGDVLPGAVEQAVSDAATCFDVDLPEALESGLDAAEIGLITQPALVVLGGGSVSLHPRFAETYHLLLDWLPNAEGVVVPGTTHFMQVENPPAIAAALADFWARHPLRDEG